jgi:hypothetical protein
VDYNNANDGVRLFAKSAIAGAVVINSGALVALLSQVSELRLAVSIDSLHCAIMLWASGITLGTSAWVAAFLAASAHANDLRRLEIVAGVVGVAVTICSIAAFLLGAVRVADGLLPVA